ncbi:MAG: cobalamin-dependent protein [Actinobacteria bacterium]|jgi:methylmalonyl-CoA mutase C-terminal domain/subunit|nr:cobalamin-dependent protein [Actinomycetota bacterium]MCL6104580.1 cobalamin-dependent protein [Actinomycetota bacterium]
MDKIKVLLAKPTQDSHDRGVRYLSHKLVQEGFEVVFINFLFVKEIVEVATEEDVAVIGISSSSGGHMPIFEELTKQLKESDKNDILVVGGGIISAQDGKLLEDMGVKKIFGPGSSSAEIVDFIRSNAPLHDHDSKAQISK